MFVSKVKREKGKSGFKTKIVTEVKIIIEAIELKFMFNREGKPVLVSRACLEGKRILRANDLFVSKESFKRAQKRALTIYNESIESLQSERGIKHKQLNLF